jgi:Tfp pilus assembly protein PilF
MRRIFTFAFAAVFAAFLAGPALAEEPAAQSTERERLFEALKNAPTEKAGRAAERAVWEYWMAAGPTGAVRDKLRTAMDALSGRDFDRAMTLLDEVVAAAPEYAEGWNQRAFAHFLLGSLDDSLEDLDRTLELEPKHFGALSGKAIVLMRQGRVRLGQKALRKAVAIHPWLKERSLLVPKAGDVPKSPDGEEI